MDGRVAQPALAGSLSAPWLQRLAVAAILALFVATLAKCAWLADDYFIGLRALDFLFAGEGLRYNPFERINVYTTLLKLPFEIAARIFTRDPLLIFASFAIVFNGLCLWLLWRLAGRRPWRWCLAVILLLASKAYIDFSWSGLENPMGHALVMGFVLAWLRLYPGLRGVDSPPDQTALRWLLILATLAPLYRHDLTLLVWPATAWAWWDINRRQGLARMALAAALVATPLAVYSLASLVYFGLPLPATAYAKLSGDTNIFHNLSIGYSAFRFLYRHDPATLALCLAVAPALWLAGRQGRPLAVGCVLTLLYIALNGGMFMGGRFFSVLFSLAVAVAIGGWGVWAQWLSRWLGLGWRRAGTVAAAALLGWALLLPGSPIASSYDYDSRYKDPDEVHIRNERWLYHWSTRMGEWLSSRRHERAYPSDTTARIGLLMREQGEDADQIIYVCRAGMTPFYAGTDYTFIDRYALGDAFLARMPALTHRSAHRNRWAPNGYFETMATGANMIEDPQLAQYYDIVRLVTGGEDLFAWERLATIVKFNLGHYEHLRIKKPPTGIEIAKFPASRFKGELATANQLIEQQVSALENGSIQTYLRTQLCWLKFFDASRDYLAQARP